MGKRDDRVEGGYLAVTIVVRSLGDRFVSPNGSKNARDVARVGFEGVRMLIARVADLVAIR